MPDVGIKLKIEGEKEYRQSLKNIIDSQKEWESEIKAVDSALESEASQEDKNRKKSELLTKSIESQEDKLRLMNDQLEKVEATYGKDSKEAKTLRTNINKASTALNKMRKEAKSVAENMGSVGKSMQNAGKKMQDFGKGMSTYVTAPIAGLAAASIAAFNEVDEGLDIVTKKTGATGENLVALQESARNLATSMPTDFATAGEAIGEVNTKFHLTGQDLEDLSAKFVKFADLNDTDVSSAVDKTQKVMQAFGVETEDAGKILDVMNATGQNTGISMDSLADSMVKNAASLSQMGMDAYDAAGFLGSLEMSGANTETVMRGMQTALTNATKEGKTLPEVLGEFSEVMSSSASEQEKLNAAIDLFGQKAGLAIYEACSKGSLSFENFASDATKYMGSVEETFDNVVDPVDELQTSMNKLKSEGEKVGSAILKAVAPPLADLLGHVGDLAEGFGELDSDAQTAILGVAGSLALIGPASHAVGTFVSGAGKVIEAGAGMVGKFGELSGAAGALAGIGGPLTVAAATLLWAGYVVKSMVDGAESSNETILSAIEVQKGNVEALDAAMEDLNKALDSGNASIEEVNSQAATALAIVDELEKLEKQSSRTAEEEGHMKVLIEELNTMYPDLKLAIDDSTGALNKSTAEVRKYVEQAKKIALIEAYTNASKDSMEALAKAQHELYKTKAQQQELNDIWLNAEKSYREAVKYNEDHPYFYSANDIQTLANDVNVARAALDEFKPTIDAASQASADAEAEWTTWQQEIEALQASTVEETEALEDHADAADDATDTVGDLADAEGDLGEAAGDAAEEVDEATQKLIDAWADAYNSAYSNLSNTAGAFEAFAEDAETSASQMAAGLQNQLAAYSNYSANLAKAIELANADTTGATAAVVQAIIDMGMDGANELQSLVTAAESGSDDFNTIISTFGDVETAKETIASQIADFSTETVQGLDISDDIKQTVNGNYKAGAESAGAVASGAESKVSEAQTAADDVAGEVEGISGDIDEANKEINKSAVQSTLGLIGGLLLNKILLGLTAKGVGQAVGDIATEADKKKSTIKESGKNAALALRDGLKNEKPAVESAASVLGQAVANGIATGLEAQRAAVVAKANSIASEVNNTIRKAWKISSPSKVAQQDAAYFGAGMVLGLEKSVPQVAKASAMLTRAVVPFGATAADAAVIRAGNMDYSGLYDAVRSGAADGQQPIVINEKSFVRALVGMGVKLA